MSHKNLTKMTKPSAKTILYGAVAAYVVSTIAIIIAGIFTIYYNNDIKKGNILINIGFILSTLLSLFHVLVGSIKNITEFKSQETKSLEKKPEKVLEKGLALAAAFCSVVAISVIITGIAHFKTDMEKYTALISAGCILSTLLSLSIALRGLIQNMQEKKLTTELQEVSKTNQSTQTEKSEYS